MPLQCYKEVATYEQTLLTLLCALLMLVSLAPEHASALPRMETPDYKVSFFFFDCFNMQDENGRRSGHGYEMMQGIAKQMQCTFTYLGYDKSANDCVEMLRNGELDIYTAARRTPELEAEFASSTHPAITSSTCMNMQMPVMDGVTAAKQIRQSTRADHDVPIFAMTANTFASDRRDAGMNGYIPKPFSVKDIEHALNVLGE